MEKLSSASDVVCLIISRLELDPTVLDLIRARLIRIVDDNLKSAEMT